MLVKKGKGGRGMKGSTREKEFLQVKEAGQKGSSQLAKTDKG